MADASPYSYLAAGSTNQDSQVVKASSGALFSMMVFNTNSTPAYIKIYDKATGPTSADTPVLRLMVPGNATNGAGYVIAFPLGVSFSNGIGHRITGALADNDTTAVSSACVLNFTYK